MVTSFQCLVEFDYLICLINIMYALYLNVNTELTETLKKKQKQNTIINVHNTKVNVLDANGEPE